MSGTIAVVEAGDSPVQAMLAVEVRTERGVVSPLPASTAADGLLLVGDAAAAEGMAGLQATRAGIAEVLADPEGVLARLGGGAGPPPIRRRRRGRRR